MCILVSLCRLDSECIVFILVNCLVLMCRVRC